MRWRKARRVSSDASLADLGSTTGETGLSGDGIRTGSAVSYASRGRFDFRLAVLRRRGRLRQSGAIHWTEVCRPFPWASAPPDCQRGRERVRGSEADHAKAPGRVLRSPSDCVSRAAGAFGRLTNMAIITAKRLTEHLTLDGFVVLKLPPLGGHSAVGQGFEG
jgi:hypothetical protein